MFTFSSAKMIEDSVGPSNVRLATMQLVYQRFVHAEFMTHRVFSRNASSSRAIPVAKMIEQVRNNPAMPVHWGKNQPGMQAREEVQHVGAAKDLWMKAAQNAADIAEEMEKIGLHKQVANRILEPFQFIHVVLTSTEWENFFALRDHPDADPNIQALAVQMAEAMAGSTPKWLDFDQWHLPYVTAEEREMHSVVPAYLCKLSAARCARVSYLTHDGNVPDPEKDLDLFNRLVGSEPIHASPTEHQGTPLLAIGAKHDLCGNFKHWIQHRKLIELDMNYKKRYAT